MKLKKSSVLPAFLTFASAFPQQLEKRVCDPSTVYLPAPAKTVTVTVNGNSDPVANAYAHANAVSTAAATAVNSTTVVTTSVTEVVVITDVLTIIDEESTVGPAAAPTDFFKSNVYYYNADAGSIKWLGQTPPATITGSIVTKTSTIVLSESSTSVAVAAAAVPASSASAGNVSDAELATTLNKTSLITRFITSTRTLTAAEQGASITSTQVASISGGTNSAEAEQASLASASPTVQPSYAGYDSQRNSSLEGSRSTTEPPLSTLIGTTSTITKTAVILQTAVRSSSFINTLSRAQASASNTFNVGPVAASNINTATAVSGFSSATLSGFNSSSTFYFGVSGGIPTAAASATEIGAGSQPTYNTTSLVLSKSVNATVAVGASASAIVSSTVQAAPASTIATSSSVLITPTLEAQAFTTVSSKGTFSSTAISGNSSATVSSTLAEATACGEHGDFTLTWDDEPVFTPRKNQSVPYPPVFNPYHHLFFSNGYAYLPPPDAPYDAISGTRFSIFLADQSETDTGSPFAARNGPGLIGSGPRYPNSAYWFNAYGAFFGCDNFVGSNECVLRISAYVYDPAKNDEKLIGQQTSSIPKCQQTSHCRLLPIEFPDTFRGLTSIRFEAFVDGNARDFFMDDLGLGWYNNTCDAGLLRLSQKK